MEFDLALVSLPAFTQKCPSIGLATLAAYLKDRYHILCYDYGIEFYKTALPQFTVTDPLIQMLKLSLYPLWGASNWVGLPDTINPEIGQALLKSLCPVCSALYQPIFTEFTNQRALTQTILESYASRLIALDVNNYGFSLMSGNAVASLYVIKRIKEEKPDATIIVGGPETSPYYRAEFYSQMKEIDFTIYPAEGQIPLDRTLSFLKGNLAKKSDIPGVYFKTKEGIQRTAPPPPLDLNNAPIPEFSIIEPHSYNLSSIDLLASTGCPYHCRFCNEPLIWGSYRPKSQKRIMDEIQHYIHSYGTTQFELGDNTFGASPSFFPALEQLTQDGVKFEWAGNCRINELNASRISKYRQFGLTHCYFGIESASPKVLALMAKQYDIQRARTILKACHEHQVRSTLYFMVGFPGETSDEFQKTCNFIDENREYISDILTSVFTLMPGTSMMTSPDLYPVQFSPKYLNAFTYHSNDGITHADRKERFLQLRGRWDNTAKV
jgi:radical SAM superfamily enzyme YgiQ (UPF0313 family)